MSQKSGAARRKPPFTEKQGQYLAFIYTYAAPAGETVFDEAAIGGPLEGGDYEIRLMRDDAYMMLGTVKFSVSSPP